MKPFLSLQMERLAALCQAREGALVGCFGFIDGLNLTVQASGNPLIQNANYNGLGKVVCVLHAQLLELIKHRRPCHRYTCANNVSNVLVWAPNGCIIWASLNSPGSYHDSATSAELFRSYDQGDLVVPPGFFIAADSAFPAGQQYPWIKKSLRQGRLDLGTVEEERVSNALTSVRQGKYVKMV